ncbi:hypothetical protein MW887_003590 [Aspergillus wentii]|nr:hypothetical protein MW887_003590 [Aspergillus wentii]
MSHPTPKFTACDACYQRKCDSGRPCNWCLHQQSDCTYVRARPRKRGRNPVRRVGLVERIRRMDERKEDAVADAKGTVEDPRSIPLLLPPRIIHFAGWEVGNLQTGVPNLLPEGLQWIKSRTGLLLPFPTSQHAPWEKPHPSTLGRREPAPKLPTKSMLKRFLDVHMPSPLHRIFPVVDSQLFSQTIEAAYSHSNWPQTQNQSAQACILTFMALVSSLNHLDPSYNDTQLPSIPRDAYIAHASAVLLAIIQEPPNLDALQTAISLVVRPCCSPGPSFSFFLANDSRVSH